LFTICILYDHFGLLSSSFLHYLTKFVCFTAMLCAALNVCCNTLRVTLGFDYCYSMSVCVYVLVCDVVCLHCYAPFVYYMFIVTSFWTVVNSFFNTVNLHKIIVQHVFTLLFALWISKVIQSFYLVLGHSELRCVSTACKQTQ